jgi:hypothetical protein
MSTRPNTPQQRNAADAGGDDMPPSGDEARAQRKATSMPFVWLLLGFLVILLFTLMMTVRPSFHSSLTGPTAATASARSAPPHKQVAD